MKFSVLSAIAVLGVSAETDNDYWIDPSSLAPGANMTEALINSEEKLFTPEEDRHWMIPDNNHVAIKNSKKQYHWFYELHQLFWGYQYQNYSPIEPLWKTDKVSTFISEENYTKHVVDASGKFILGKPMFIYWPKWSAMNNWLPAYSLNTLARHFEGNIAFRYADVFTDEKLRMTYEIYKYGKAFYIDEEGKAYIYPGMISTEGVKDWIENRKYRMSPFQFAAPAVISDYRLKWADIKKEVRWWYADNLRDHIEPTLRKIGFTYIVDMDPLDWDNVKLNQKTDRQIIFLVSFILWIVEYIYDLTCGASPAEKKAAAPKSFLKKKATADSAAKTPTKKARGDKIE